MLNTKIPAILIIALCSFFSSTVLAEPKDATATLRDFYKHYFSYDYSCPFGKPAYHEGTIAGKVRWGSWCWISLNKREM